MQRSAQLDKALEEWGCQSASSENVYTRGAHEAGFEMLFDKTVFIGIWSLLEQAALMTPTPPPVKLSALAGVAFGCQGISGAGVFLLGFGWHLRRKKGMPSYEAAGGMRYPFLPDEWPLWAAHWIQCAAYMETGNTECHGKLCTWKLKAVSENPPVTRVVSGSPRRWALTLGKLRWGY